MGSIPQFIILTAAALGAALALAVFAGVVWMIWKRALLSVQSEAIEQYRSALDAAKEQIEALTRKMDDMEKARTEDREEIARLRGVVEGKQETLEDVIVAIAGANVCLTPDCHTRTTPTF